MPAAWQRAERLLGIVLLEAGRRAQPQGRRAALAPAGQGCSTRPQTLLDSSPWPISIAMSRVLRKLS